LQLEEDEHWSWHKHKLRWECMVNPLRLRVSSPPNIAFSYVPQNVSQSVLWHAGRLTAPNGAPQRPFRSGVAQYAIQRPDAILTT
jgi:hypothetical protein